MRAVHTQVASETGQSSPEGPAGTLPREVVLPHGRLLTVRAVVPADATGLQALYDGLSADDRYRRFFSSYRPDAGFFERMTTIAERGGFGLVAELRPAGEGHQPEPGPVGSMTEPGAGPGEDARAGSPAVDRRIVGEASYTLLPNGDGELAITVDHDWRGWLGHYLLDALADEAAARGVANLEAYILTANTPMLALARSRGFAAIEHPDWSIVKVALGTSGRVPTWPSQHDRPRILVELPGAHWHAEEAAREAGLELMACPGPGGGRRGCPALAGRPCPLVEGADVVVVAGPQDERMHALLEAHAAVHPGVPVCVELRGAASTGAASVAVPGTATPVVPRVDDAAVVAFVQRLACGGDDPAEPGMPATEAEA